MSRFFILILFILANNRSTGQRADTLNIKLKPAHFKIRWNVIGISGDPIVYANGISLSNGIDEAGLIHFEDITANWLYKFQGELGYNGGYSYGGKFGRNDLLKPFLDPQLSYFKRSLTGVPEQQDIYLSSKLFIKRLPFEVEIKGGYQSLDSLANAGIGVGLQKRFKLLYTGISVVTHFQYSNFAAFLQGFIVKNKLSYRVLYERINKTDFSTLELHFVFRKILSN